MTFSWPFGRRGDSGWHDAAEDPLPARLRALGPADDDVSGRVARRRGAVLAAFAARHVAPAATGPWRPRRLAFAMVTATLLLAVTAGGIAASGPGLPAYPIRLAVEELLLPAGAAARLEGQMERLERRLEEASGASNANAASTALAAYERIAAEIVSMAPPAGSDGAWLETRVSEQLRSLQRMGGGQGADGVRTATRSATGLLRWLGGVDPDAPTPGTSDVPSPTPDGADRTSASPGPDGSSQPSAPSVEPARSPGPRSGSGDQGPDEWRQRTRR